jgi:hypothetical protein
MKISIKYIYHDYYYYYYNNHILRGNQKNNCCNQIKNHKMVCCIYLNCPVLFLFSFRKKKRVNILYLNNIIILSANNNDNLKNKFKIIKL